ncbi:hypothetical protein B5K08_31770 [Rhizobium leguminosarum bv. trifolii]|uniref:Uncharacterized protein n=1 Tax=Rhizobium leguminosarum bv. trifolii TaxID=386 RepID=A0A3E1AYQ3_RHILT|nr:hypothetical protein B5K10_31765 [Rhizobium leguminosarum bv. trifolii]RFB82784.1 hypothetical protein B5K08_31770 [Rhizobium leguminosarum bv. trifolii]
MRFSVNIASKSVSKVTRFGISGNNAGQELFRPGWPRPTLHHHPCGEPAFSARPPGLMGASA